MYIRTSETLRETQLVNFVKGRALSRFGDQTKYSYPGLGQPSLSIPACISKPSWIPSLKHYFTPKLRIFRPIPPFQLQWIPTHLQDELQSDKLNPGYLDATTHGLLWDTKLDRKLKDLIARMYAKSHPFDREPFKTFVDNGGLIKVALVDLSTSRKLLFPKVAEFNATHMTLGGSLAKIGLLYAAYQNRFDFNVKGARDPASFTPDGLRHLRTMYHISQDRGSPVLTFAFNTVFEQALKDICSNCAASKISRSLGLRYINSALWQSGLYDCHWGGIWLGAHYNEWDSMRKRWECDKAPYHYKGICTTLGCQKDPLGGHNIALNALSVATFFTLLAQGRLIDDFSSDRIKDVLIDQPDECGNSFKMGLEAAGRFTATDRIYLKIGETSSLSHEGALIDRTSIGKKYVAVVLSISRTDDRDLVLQELIVHLDKLIEMNS